MSRDEFVARIVLVAFIIAAIFCGFVSQGWLVRDMVHAGGLMIVFGFLAALFAVLAAIIFLFSLASSGPDKGRRVVIEQRFDDRRPAKPVRA